MSWIKMRAELLDHPKVVAMADFLNHTWLSRREKDALLFPHPASPPYNEMWVVGALFSVWVWVDQHSEDGTNVRVTSAFLDRRTACPDFAAAMRTVDWLTGRDGCLTFPDFSEHNGETAKRRASEAKRKQEQRAEKEPPKPASGTFVPPPCGPEKRREEKRREDRPPPRVPPSAALDSPDSAPVARLMDSETRTLSRGKDSKDSKRFAVTEDDFPDDDRFHDCARVLGMGEMVRCGKLWLQRWGENPRALIDACMEWKAKTPEQQQAGGGNAARYVTAVFMREAQAAA